MGRTVRVHVGILRYSPCTSSVQLTSQGNVTCDTKLISSFFEPLAPKFLSIGKHKDDVFLPETTSPIP